MRKIKEQVKNIKVTMQGMESNGDLSEANRIILELGLETLQELAQEQYYHWNRKKFVFLVKKAKDCLFSRREGHRGKIICGYSFVIRLFGCNITKW